jgi:penicillin-binding protein-related factor A (putative recombinase)
LASTPEVKVKAKIKALLTARGAFVRLTVMGGYGHTGQLDMYACYKGFYIGIEAKATKTSKVTALQQAEIEDILKAGGYAHVIYDTNLADLVETLDEIDLIKCTSTRPTSG